MAKRPTQRDRAIAFLKERGIARSSELATAGVSTATIARMKQNGLVAQLGRGLYQLPDAPIETHHSLAEAAKRAPKGVIALTSALAFHDLTDVMPSMVWMAIGPKDREPQATNPPMQLDRLVPRLPS